MPNEQVTDESQREPPLLARVRAWAAGGRWRGLLVAAGLVALAAATVSVWVALALYTTQSPPPVIDVALEKLDEGDLEFAERYVRQMQRDRSIATREYGGPLFVLGAVRAMQAERQWAPERRRHDYLVASKYLNEARALGVPEGREYEALYLLGKACIGSRQLELGVEVLEEALAAGIPEETSIHGLLCRAHFYADYPDYPKSLHHAEQVLADAGIEPQARGPAVLRRARALSRLRRHAEAQRALDDYPEQLEAARARLVAGQLLVAAARDEADAAARHGLLNRAEAALADAARLDRLSTGVSAEAAYLRGRVDEQRGDPEGALRRYSDVRKRFGMTPAGVAASLGEGQLLLADGQHERALEALRRATDSLQETAMYQSDLLSLGDIKATLLAAHGTLTEEQQFDSALALVDELEHLLGVTQTLELRAETQQSWGRRLLERAQATKLPELRRRGRRRLREAGVTFEELADQRYATEKYPADLWRAAESYFRGQSFTSAVRVLRGYIKNEPRDYNAQALLRLGQAHLSLGDASRAIEAFEECIEFHPHDAAVYAARLSAARAHRDRAQHDRAEELLRVNLTGGTLSPRSPEWRDSKFELGSLLHEVGRHTEAIDHFEEAINRYPDAPQRLTARYLVAESYRQAADEPMRRLAEAKAVNEREKNERLFKEYLDAALAHYDAVQREISRSNVTNATDRAMLRNCYMFKGSVLFDLGRFNPGYYRQAVEEFSNVSALYQNEPFVLETLVQISFCWRRLGEAVKARGNIQQAILALERLPEDAPFLITTNRTRGEWKDLLEKISAF